MKIIYNLLGDNLIAKTRTIPDSTGHSMYIHLMSNLGSHVRGHEWNIVWMSIRGHKTIYIIYVNPMDV